MKTIECDYLVVGAGIFGAVVAERIADCLGRNVLVIDKRNHIGGNCHSEYDPESGIEYHTYGTHVFHTSSPAAYRYLRKFDELNGYHHQVLANHRGKLYQLPINLETINTFFNENFTPEEAKSFITGQVSMEGIAAPRNLEEMAVSLIGRKLYEAFIKGYTTKQWGKEPTNLPAEIIQRLPVRFDYREEYFNDARWQGIPLNGYTALINKILDHRNITTRLNCDYFEAMRDISVRKCTIFTGAIDAYYNHCFGRLEWRGVRFDKRVAALDDYQGTAVVNYPDREIGYTRVHEPKHLHPERCYDGGKTIIIHEWPEPESKEPCYPVNNAENMALYKKYSTLAEKEPGVLFGGRLGSYAYYDMDKAIIAALECYEAVLKLKSPDGNGLSLS